MKIQKVQLATIDRVIDAAEKAIERSLQNRPQTKDPVVHVDEVAQPFDRVARADAWGSRIGRDLLETELSSMRTLFHAADRPKGHLLWKQRRDACIDTVEVQKLQMLTFSESYQLNDLQEYPKAIYTLAAAAEFCGVAPERLTVADVERFEKAGKWWQEDLWE